MCDFINTAVTNQNLGIRPCQFFNGSSQGFPPRPPGNMNFSGSGFPMPTQSGAFQTQGFGAQYQTPNGNFQGFNGMQNGQSGQFGSSQGFNGFNGMQSGQQFGSNQGFGGNMQGGSGNQGFMRGPPPAGFGMGGPGMGGPGMGGPGMGMMGSFQKAVCLTTGTTMNNTMSAMDQYLQQNPTVGIRCHTACPCSFQCPPDWSQRGPMMMAF